MKIEINPKIIEITTKCTKNFDCLTDAQNIYCKVNECIQDEVHFVECRYRDYCTYRMTFGDSFICQCPTRKEIYNKYGI